MPSVSRAKAICHAEGDWRNPAAWKRLHWQDARVRKRFAFVRRV